MGVHQDVASNVWIQEGIKVYSETKADITMNDFTIEEILKTLNIMQKTSEKIFKVISGLRFFARDGSLFLLQNKWFRVKYFARDNYFTWRKNYIDSTSLFKAFNNIEQLLFLINLN